MYTSPQNRGSPFRKEIPEGPIHDFATVIENTAPEDWQKRTQALASLVATIPSGSNYSAYEAWYNSPPTLRHLAFPLSALLKDARSTVVKRSCESASELFSKCQIDARYLLKDIMPAIMAVHAQTVKVILTYVQNMVLDAMSVVPCKMAMPVWLDRLKSDKSRTVREACALYLGAGLSEWGDDGYLSIEIWNQVGAALVKSLKDPSPQVRQNSKKSLEILHQQNEDVFDRLAASRDLIRDVRVKKVLQRIQAGETVGDDVSVASSRVGSVASRASYRAGGSVSGMRNTRNPNYYTATGRAAGRSTMDNNRPMGIPKTIGVATSPTSTSSRPVRKGLGPPVRVAAPFKAAVESPPPISRKVEVSNGIDENPALSASFDTVDTADSELPAILNADELREVAKQSRSSSRRSSMLQERFAKSSSNLESSSTRQDTHDSLLDDILDGDEEVVQADKTPAIEVVPEHVKIAYELLEAHKKHVDHVMETLKVEMDALKEFELLLSERAPQQLTEDEVLNYFESVGLCLEQRTKAAAVLQKKMDRVATKGGT